MNNITVKRLTIHYLLSPYCVHINIRSHNLYFIIYYFYYSCLLPATVWYSKSLRYKVISQPIATHHYLSSAEKAWSIRHKVVKLRLWSCNGQWEDCIVLITEHEVRVWLQTELLLSLFSKCKLTAWPTYKARPSSHAHRAAYMTGQAKYQLNCWNVYVCVHSLPG